MKSSADAVPHQRTSSAFNSFQPNIHMPFVNVKITRDGVTVEQKAQIVKEITETLQRVLGKKPEHIHIVIDEVELENWGFAGRLTSELRQRNPK
jgi:4-oxalocrotonate tautomerase